MAVINKDNSYMEFPLQISRQYAASIEKYEIFYALVDAQNYAQTNPLAYVGQRVVVVDESNQDVTIYAIKNISGDLKEVGDASGGSIQSVADQSGMLGLTEAKQGDQVYRQDTKTIWILTGSDPTNIASWSEVSGGAASWQGTQNKVGFYALNNSTFKTLDPKDSNTLYFITDLGKIYKGTGTGVNDYTDVTSALSFVTDSNFGEATDAVTGMLYIDTTTLECRFVNGSSWATLLPGYVTDGSNWASGTDDSKLATIGAIKTGINQAISQAISSQLSSKLDKIEGGIEDNLVTIGTEGSIKDSLKKIGGATISESPDANTVATEAAVIDALSWDPIASE